MWEVFKILNTKVEISQLHFDKSCHITRGGFEFPLTLSLIPMESVLCNMRASEYNFLLVDLGDNMNNLRCLIQSLDEIFDVTSE